MAKENTVELYGIIDGSPTVMVNEKMVDGKKEIQKIASIHVLTIRRRYVTEELLKKGRLQSDVQWVVSKNKEFIEKNIEHKLEDGDFIRIKGTLCTEDIAKAYICPNCRQRFVKSEAVNVYINPIHLSREVHPLNEYIKSYVNTINVYRRHLMAYAPLKKEEDKQKLPGDIKVLKKRMEQLQQETFCNANLVIQMEATLSHLDRFLTILKEEEPLNDISEILANDAAPIQNYAFQILRNYDEISNEIRIFGTLCRDPEFYENENKKECQFEIASNRIRRIKEDEADKKTDYIWVKCYGPEAQQHTEVLHMGSEVYIGGAIRNRNIKLSLICPHCGTVCQKNGSSTEIIPYHVEYIKNCDIPFSEVEEEGDDFEAEE